MWEAKFWTTSLMQGKWWCLCLTWTTNWIIIKTCQHQFKNTIEEICERINSSLLMFHEPMAVTHCIIFWLPSVFCAVCKIHALTTLLVWSLVSFAIDVGSDVKTGRRAALQVDFGVLLNPQWMLATKVPKAHARRKLQCTSKLGL